MKISKINIRNILGIEELELTPTGFNTMSGPNGSGKTSVLEAIKSCFAGGHDATLLRKGETSGEIVIVLDDGTEINKRVGASASSTVVTGPDGKKKAKPAETIRGLTDLLSINPVEFLTAPKKDRVKIMLEAMPIELDTTKLTKLSGIKVASQPGVHALSVIDAVHKQVFDDRTGTKRVIKEKESTINQMELAMPAPIGGVDGNEDSMRATIEAAREAKDAELNRINAKLADLKTANQTKIDALRDKLQQDIDALKAAAMGEVSLIQATLATTEEKAATQRDKTNQKFNDIRQPLANALDMIKNNRENVAKREQALEMVGKMKEELTDLVDDAKKQTNALADIDQYKLDLLADLPISGLEVRDGEIFRDNVPFDRLNTQQQVAIAVEIAKLKAGELGVVCLDGLELLDSENLEAFKENFAASNLQAFITRVSDEEFAIVSE